MIEYNAVGLLYTYKCTGTCEICGLKCGPNRNEKMDLELLVVNHLSIMKKF